MAKSRFGHIDGKKGYINLGDRQVRDTLMITSRIGVEMGGDRFSLFIAERL
ncbi:MAG: hypothetical protein F6K40_19165 [Okeania sp. SIO3I5]|uniref:hypothetical protein n=1 Tax=Okeania sp. SIO3I5 TaxID=2607805 RepID=UPI0013BD9E03|nr:hypothetical protein [Okeania sp. SIO3I5]NEQ38265.1 hypothetical protein [Okeania sp. SIO3I5]